MNIYYIVLELVPGNGYSKPYGLFDDEEKAVELAKKVHEYTGNPVEVATYKINQAPSFKE